MRTNGFLAAIGCCLLLATEVSAQEAEPQPPAAPQTDKRRLRRLFAVLKKEPSIRDVQRATTQYYDLDPERVRSLARMARIKGLIPNVQVRFSNSLTDSFENKRDGLYPQLPGWPDLPNPSGFKEVNASSSDNLAWEVSAQFDLDRLVFSSEALDARSLSSLSESLVREVTTLFYSRRRIIISLVLSPPATAEEYLYELTRLDEMTATIDALSGHMFEKRAWRWEDSDLINLPK
jgi:hypothetical protein